MIFCQESHSKNWRTKNGTRKNHSILINMRRWEALEQSLEKKELAEPRGISREILERLRAGKSSLRNAEAESRKWSERIGQGGGSD